MDTAASPPADPVTTAIGIGFMLVMLLIWLAVLVLFLASMWKIHAKAGRPGWGALIPIYNLIEMCEIIGKPGWYWLLTLIPIFGIYPAIVMVHGLSRSFGKDAGYTVGLVLLGFVFYPMLAFGSSSYQGPAYAEATAKLQG